MDNIFVIMRPDGTPFHRDDAMGILATDSEAQAIRFQHAREEEGAEYVRYMRTQPPPAASVSERDGSSAHCIGGGNWSPWDLFRLSTDMKLPVNLPAEKAIELRRDIERALEQALTQQRGAVWPLNTKPENGWTFDPDFLDEIKTRAEQSDIGDFAPGLEGVESVLIALRDMHATTPQPSADAARELVQRWRECAKSVANGPMFDGASEYAVAGTYGDCADELESLLGRGGK